MSHTGLGLRCCCCEVEAAAAGVRDSVSSSPSVDSTVAAVDVDGAVVVAVAVAGTSALVVLVRNGRSNASFNRETFLGPKPGNRVICVALACAIRAKLYYAHMSIVTR